MATAGSKQGGGSSKPPAAAGQELDPRYEWEENASSFILRIHLSGFRKQDFRVQVDGAGRLTVRGQRSDAAAANANARHSRFNKVFQLPSTSNLDDIAGRFDLGVLTLTVPKRLPAPAKEDQQQAKKPEDADADAAAATKQVAGAKGAKSEPEQQHKEAAAKEDKPKAAAAAAAPAPAADTTAKEDKPKAAAAAPAPAADTKKQPETQANAESKATDPTESLAERRTEEERANANAAAAAEHQRKACRGFKERVAEELQGLAGSEWAEGLVETVKRNREVIAVAVAAFSLGVFVSSRLFSRSSRN
ncbi:uncharacterized protein LOC100284584 [Zea mays]|uniref:SHSP domain-containing protein n=1 Tax=Zea mays TaxID=4577 RepID=A0A804Q3C7_MAIZE|nr:uncharacterized protein LOC100284584 [Zea mays]